MAGSDARWDGHFWQDSSRCEADKRFSAGGRAATGNRGLDVPSGERERMQPSAHFASDSDGLGAFEGMQAIELWNCTAPSLARRVSRLTL